MPTRLLFVLLFFFTGICLGNAQNKNLKKITVTGTVTDYQNNPVKGAFIFIDSLKTNVKTNKKGNYKIKLNGDTKLLTVFSFNHGVIDIGYNKQKKVNFIFPEGTKIVTEKELEAVGYDFSFYNGKNSSYDNYRDIFELLKSRFPNVIVIGETIRLRGTGRSLNGSFPPVFLVNGSQVSDISAIAPINIKSIVIDKGKTSLYGSRGAGGVIKITLK